MLEIDSLRRFGERELADLPSFEALRARARRRQLRRRNGIALAALAAVVVVTGLVSVGRGPSTNVVAVGAMTLADLPEGVSPSEVGGVPIFVDRQGAVLRAFVARSTHLPAAAIQWCPREEVFISRAHGEVWSRDGSVANGPAPRGLDELVPEVSSGGRISLALTSVTPGAPARADLPASPVGRVDGYCSTHVDVQEGADRRPLFRGPLPATDDVNLALVASARCASVRPSDTDVQRRLHFTLNGCATEQPLEVVSFHDQAPGLPWVALVRTSEDAFARLEARNADDLPLSGSMAVISDPDTGFGIVVGTGPTPTRFVIRDDAAQTISAVIVPDPQPVRCPDSVHSFESRLVGEESADGLPPSGTATLAAAESLAAARGGRVVSVLGRSWHRDDHGAVVIAPETIHMVELLVATPEECPAMPSIANGVPLAYVYPRQVGR